MQRRGDHQAKGDAAEFFAHELLRHEHVGDDVGQRAVVADAAGQQVIDPVAHALIHHPRAEFALFHRRPDPAQPADAVDRAEVMCVARFGQDPAIEINAQAGAEQGLLDVVRGQGVAGQEHVDIAQANDLFEELAAAGVHDGGTGDDRRAPARGPVLGQLPRDLADGHVLGLLGRDVAAHELEGLRSARALFRKDPHAGMADDDLVAHAGLGHRQAAGGQAIDVDDDRAVHFLIGDFQPAAGDADFGPLVRGAIEIFGKGPGNVGRDQTAVASVGRRRAVVGDLGEDFPQHLFLVSADFQPCIAGIVPRLPDRDLLDLANAPAASDESRGF